MGYGCGGCGNVGVWVLLLEGVKSARVGGLEGVEGWRVLEHVEGSRVWRARGL